MIYNIILIIHESVNDVIVNDIDDSGVINWLFNCLVQTECIDKNRKHTGLYDMNIGYNASLICISIKYCGRVKLSAKASK